MSRRRSRSRSRSRAKSKSKKKGSKLKTKLERKVSKGLNKLPKGKNTELQVVSITAPVDSLSADLLALRDNPDTCDMVFIVGKERKKFPAHKFVIAVNSELGVRLFAKGESEIDVPDVEPEVFKYVLDACYSSFMHFPTDMVPAVRTAAKAYGLDSVAKQLSKYMTTELNIANCIDMYEHNEELLNDATFGVEFILDNFRDVAKHKTFVNLSEQKLLHLLKQDELKATEAAVVDAVVKWGKHRVSLGRVEESKSDVDVARPLLRKALENVLPFLRLGTMSPSGVSPLGKLGLFTTEELLDVMTYLHCKKAGETRKCMFGTEPRQSGCFMFKWARTGNNGEIEEDGKKFACNHSGYCCAIGDTPMPENTGVYYFEVCFTQMNSGSWNGALGVGTDSINLSTYMSSSNAGWAYFSQGSREHASGSGSDHWGGAFQAGDRIGCAYDSDNGSLYYFKNDEFLGKCWDNVSGTVYPVVHLNNTGTHCVLTENSMPSSFEPS